MVSDENLALKLRCAISIKYTPHFEGFILKNECEISHLVINNVNNLFILIIC